MWMENEMKLNTGFIMSNSKVFTDAAKISSGSGPTQMSSQNRVLECKI